MFYSTVHNIWKIMLCALKFCSAEEWNGVICNFVSNGWNIKITFYLGTSVFFVIKLFMAVSYDCKGVIYLATKKQYH
jgi:hypothetical protein